ncbi:MAG: hypothetical protein ABIK28_25520, partial [Planctomycetota bacterium]
MIDQDPGFVDAPSGDFHLSAVSPCINRGTNASAPDQDLDGDARPYMGTHLLEADMFSISCSAGGTLRFTVHAGPANGNRYYLICGGITGNAPGILVPDGAVIPVNPDLYSYYILSFLNTAMFINFMGKLMPDGYGVAIYDTLGPLPMAILPYDFTFTCTMMNPYDFVTNPVNIDIQG